LSSVCVSICLCVWLYVCPSVPVSISTYVHLYVCPSLCMSISTCVHLYVCPSLRVSISMCVHLYVCPSLRMSISTCVHLYVCPSLRVSISTYVHLYVCPSLRVSISTCVHLYVCVSVWPIFVHPSNPTAHQLKKTQLQTSNYPMSYKFYRKNTRNTNEEQQKMPNLKHNICHRCKFSHIYSIEMSKRHTNKTRDMVIFLSEENIAINVFASRPCSYTRTSCTHVNKETK